MTKSQILGVEDMDNLQLKREGMTTFWRQVSQRTLNMVANYPLDMTGTGLRIMAEVFQI